MRPDSWSGKVLKTRAGAVHRAASTEGQARRGFAMLRGWLPLFLVALTGLACNLRPGIPVTPTIAPTVVATATDAASPTAIALLPSSIPTSTFTATTTPVPPTATHTPTPLPSPTPTFTPTDTPTEKPTLLPSESPSATVPPTNTPRPTETPTVPSPTPTDTPSASPTVTPTVPTVTPRPTDTLVPSPTALPPTSTNTPAPPSNTPLPTATPTPTLIPQPARTPVPTLASLPTLVPTKTFAPLPTMPPTLVPLPTLPPTLAQPAATLNLPTPTSGQGGGTPVPPPTFTPTAIRIGLIPTLSGGAGINTEGGVIQVASGAARDADTNVSGRVALIDANGRLYLDGALASLKLPQGQQKYTLVRWSPNGRYLAYVLESDNARSGSLPFNLTVDDGLYVLDTQSNIARHVLRHFYVHGGQSPYQYRIVVDVIWAPDSFAMLAVVLSDIGTASIIVGIDTSAQDDPRNKPGLFEILPYSSGVWQADSRGFIGAKSGTAAIGIVDRDSHQMRQLIADGAALGMWIQNATQLADGRFAFLGKPSPSGTLQGGATGLSLYILTPGSTTVQALSQPVPGTVIQATWNRANTALLVRNDAGQTLVVTIGGAIRDYSSQAAGGNVHWR